MATHNGTDLIKQMNALTIQSECLAIWSLGQMGVAIKGDQQRVLYIDPVLTDVVTIKIPESVDHFTRAFQPPLKPSDITNASFVLCTHEHLDHADPLTLGPIAQNNPSAKFIAPKWVDLTFEEAGITNNQRIFPDVNDALEFDGIKIWAIPAAHYQVEHHETLGYRYFSYLIQWNGVCFFHSGDTLLYPDYMKTISALPRADIALVAANGRDYIRETENILGNMLPSEAVWLAKQLSWDVLLGGHNDLFEWNTLPISELFEAGKKIHPTLKIHNLQPGELFYYIR